MADSIFVFIVTADPSQGQFLRSILEGRGYRVSLSSNPSLAVEDISVTRPDIVLLDLPLAGASSSDLIRELKDERRTGGVPVMVLTHFTKKEEIAEVLEAGADDVVYKPIFFVEMVNRLERIARQGEKQNTLQTLQYLVEMSDAATSSLSGEDILYVITKRVSSLMEVERCSIIVVGSEPHRGFVVAAFDNPHMNRLELDLIKYPEVMKAVEEGRPVVIEDPLSDPLLSDFRLVLSRLDITSMGAFPVSVKEKTVGVLLIHTRREKKGFTEREMKTLSIAANISGMVFKNSPLVEEVRGISGERGVIPKGYEEAVIDIDDRLEDLIQELEGKEEEK